MDDKLRQQLHDLTLQARHDLMTEARDLLEGVYGLHGDGRLEPVATLPTLQSLPEALAARARLEALLHDEQAAGLSGRAAVDALVKEVAFTHLNRMVAFKLLEARRLIRGTLDRYHDSNAFKFYLADPDHAADLALYEQGDFPQDALGEGPRDAAYRRFLLWQSAQMAREIKVLFDPQTLPSHLFPRPRALKALIEALNASALQAAWAPGNEETIGWVYQAFNAEELEQAFRDARVSGKKFEARDIPAVTQLFTPRWIVQFLVENTLGRMWVDMHPDSALATELAYLVPLKGGGTERLKPVRNIRLLDPSCGTMHFGLVAFDLFAQMYREELERAGQPGWPERASVKQLEDIPAAILAHNIYGIDIDLRAVQLSSLTLYFKAKALNPKALLVNHYLACADVSRLDDHALNQFLSSAGLDRPTYRRILHAVQARLGDAAQLGSLLPLEQEIRALIEQERAQYRWSEQNPDFFDSAKDVFESAASTDEFWALLEQQVIAALDAYALQQADHTFFVGETGKGLRLLELLLNTYDVVVTNPPYLSNRKMNSRLKTLLTATHPEGKGDLYAAFIQRCLNLCGDGGRVGMLTMHSFMFISSYEALRGWIGARAAIDTALHLGPALFAVGNPGTLQTAAFVLRREPAEQQRINTMGTYLRLVKEPDAEAKRLRFEHTLARLRAGADAELVYRYRQGDFATIPDAPWVYWITPSLRRLFKELAKLDDVAESRVGLQTSDNFRFLRYWWEPGRQKIAFHCVSREECETSIEKWYPYMKGGSYRKWYGNHEYCINYGQNGYELKAWADPLYGNSGWSRIIKSTEFYFRRGITWSDLTSGRFSARLSPGGFVFDVKGSSAFPKNIPLVLGLLNSSFAHYALNLLNPTVSFQVGDLSRLPIPATSSTTMDVLVEQAIALAKADSEESETTYDFIAPPSWATGLGDVAERRGRLAEVEAAIDEEVYRLYGIADADRAAIEAELADPVALLAEGEEPTAVPAESEEDAPPTSSPLSRQELARRWVSYAIGIALGRFQPGVAGGLGRGDIGKKVAAELRALADADGIMVLEAVHPDALRPQVERALELLLGHDPAAEVVALATGGKPFDDYIAGEWWKTHVKDYRKRPVYWLIQSPKRSYSLLAFHERLTPDSLYLLQGTRYLQGKLNGVRAQASDLQAAVGALAPGRERKAAEKDLERLLALLSELEEFSRLLQAVTGRTNERGEVAGWRPELDDGVLINLAPLHQLLPAWGAEPKKAWEALARGEYDWSRTALRYWPERVLAQCRTNTSFAIAHGLDRDGDHTDAD